MFCLFNVCHREERIIELESELEKLRLKERGTGRGWGAGNLHVPHPMEINTARYYRVEKMSLGVQKCKNPICPRTEISYFTGGYVIKNFCMHV